MALAKENDGILVGFGLIFDQTAVKKTTGNPCYIFYRDVIIMMINSKDVYMVFMKHRSSEVFSHVTILKLGRVFEGEGVFEILLV